MALTQADRTNFETLRRAFLEGNAALMECTDQKSGEPRAVVCAVEVANGEYTFVPFAAMAWDNPYELFSPPT